MHFDPALAVHPEPVPDFIYNPPTDEISVLWQDDDLLVVEKPAGLLSVPGKHIDHADCLETRLKSTFPNCRTVHRLDMDTSGVMVFAMNGEAHRHLGLQFERRHVSKTYIAMVAGHVKMEKGTIDLPLRCDWPNRPKQMVCFEQGRRSTTHWKVLEYFDGATRLELTPETGRSHQLRVHLMACGHPILGDMFYANPAERRGRLKLHAHTLEVHHPVGGKRHIFTSPCPF